MNFSPDKVLKKAFGMFDQKKTGSIEVNKVAAILNTMGQQFDDDELQQLCTDKAKGMARGGLRYTDPVYTSN